MGRLSTHYCMIYQVPFSFPDKTIPLFFFPSSTSASTATPHRAALPSSHLLLPPSTSTKSPPSPTFLMSPPLLQQQVKHCSSNGSCKNMMETTTGTAQDDPAVVSDVDGCIPVARPPVVQRQRSSPPGGAGAANAGTVRRSLLSPLPTLLPTCQKLAMPSLPSKTGTLSRKRVTGTLYGHRKGRASFAVQDEDSSSEPLLLLELAITTGQLVKEMASGTVRILLECEQQSPDDKKNKNKNRNQLQQQQQQHVPLWEEPVWTMFWNGRKAGYAATRTCGDPDRRVLQAVRAVSAGAGVLPPPSALTSSPQKGKKAAGCCPGGGGCDAGCNSEVMYMRAKFERVVGSKDSEAFYMISPGRCKAAGAAVPGGGPELCIFLLRL